MLRRTGQGRRRADLRLERLEGRRLLASLIVEGSKAGRAAEIRVLDADRGTETFRFAPFGPKRVGGVNVAVGDVDGDGSLDMVATLNGSANPLVRVFRATDGSKIGQFDLPRSLAGKGLSLATGDVNGDGKADIVVAPTSGSPQVRVYSGVDGRRIGIFRATTPGSAGGVRVAVGDVNGDGLADIAATAVRGKSAVRVFSGEDFQAIASISPFAVKSGGRADVALADLNGDRRLEVVAALPQGRSAVIRAYDPNTGDFLGQAIVDQASSAGGVRIASVNLGGRGADELVIAPSSGKGGAAVLAASAWKFSGLSASAVADPAVAYRLTSGGGLSYAGGNSVAFATPAFAVSSLEPPLSQDLPVLDRLALFDVATGTFVPVQANDPRLAGKDITVISHGWAPGYQDWVDHEATVNNHVLKWWETFPDQPGFDAAYVKANPTPPDSPFLLQGLTASSIFGSRTVSTTGLAQTIAGRVNPGTGAPADPNAVVLAYSWIDDSATPTWDFLTEQIPEESYRSEALTTLNGERLAEALSQAVGSNFGGQIQLVGHSHGSKVVSVASVAGLAAGLPIKQVTILDSPEDDVTVIGDAANYNWFFLKDLQGLDRQDPSGVFVDSYASEFGISYSGITLSNGEGTDLGQIVDVNLFPEADSSINLGARHSYAAGWYAGSGEPAVTFGQSVGQAWSPLLPANAGSASPISGLPSYAEQNWSEFSFPADQQYVLNPMDGGASTETITFKPLKNAAVSLTQSGTMVSSPPSKFSAPLSGQSGIAFDYQFTNAKPGDRLIVLAGGDPAFAMDAALVGPGVAHATISLYSLPLESHSLTFVLTSAAGNTTSGVTVSNFQTFSQPLLSA